MIKYNLQFFGGRGSAGGNKATTGQEQFGHKFLFGKDRLKKGNTYRFDTTIKSLGIRRVEYEGYQDVGGGIRRHVFFGTDVGRIQLTDNQVWYQIDYDKKKK